MEELLTIKQFASIVSALIPLATFGALLVTVVLFVKNKGTMDALKEAVSTYKSLSESKEAEIKQLEKRQEQLELRITELEKVIETQKGAVSFAVDELLHGFARHGICAKAGTCGEFKAKE